MKKIFDLQLFADGGDAGAMAGADTADNSMGEDKVDATPKRKNAKENPLANVKYGLQKEQQKQETSENDGDNTENPDKEFEDLIKGRYKDQYGKSVQEIIQKRFKNSNDNSQLQNYQKVMDAIAGKYGKSSDDIDGLLKAIEEDSAYLEHEALEQGITVEQLKHMRALERNNATYERQLRMQQEEAARRERFNGWVKESESMKEIYPNFDLGTELQNKDFVKLVESNVPIQTAYQVVHQDEIMSGMIEYTTKQVKSKISQQIQSGKNRPTENGMNSQASSQVKSEAKNLTKADRKEIMRRVERGENISF